MKNQQLIFEKNSFLEKELAKKNRELEIEASLERIRTRAVAMRTSEEINALIGLIFNECVQLGIHANRTILMTFDKETGDARWWMANPQVPGTPMNFLVKNHNFLPAQAHLDAWKKRIEKWIYPLEGENKAKWDQYIFTETELSKLPQSVKTGMQSVKNIIINASFQNYGGIVLPTFEQLDDESFDLLVKISKVFDLTYTRFLDLQKAEAQAREAQIEAALERVRSRSMMMHTSKELKEVAKEMRNQFSLLGQKELETCAIHLWNEASHQLEAWAALRNPDNTGEIIESETRLDIKGIRILEEAFQKYIAGKKDYVIISANEKAKEFFSALKKTAPQAYEFLSGRTKNIKPEDITAYWSISDFHGGSLVMVTMNQPDDNSRALLRRFANVFGQAYQRFKDLQKAETQAREAQIEAALESVRASSMAMHHSNELENVVKTLAVKLTELGLSLDGALILFFDKKTRDISLWIATNQLPDPIKVKIPHSKAIQSNLIIQDLWAAFETGNGFMNKSYSGKIKNDYFRFTVKNNLSKIPKPIRQFEQEAKSWTFSAVAGKHSLLGIDSWYEKFITEQDYQVLIRFSNAFEHAYTRFLDLQKAEAQAREAQIEAALERVRSRSMAMQKAGELKEVIRLVLEQFVHLKINAQHAGFYIDYKAQDDMHIWLADPNLEPFFAVIPYFDTPTWNSFREAKAKGTTFHTDLLDFEEKNKFYNSLFELFTVPDEAKQFYLQCKGLAVSTVLLDSVGLYIENFEAIPYSEEENKVLLRFGKVFQQTYTRFLDLQKAEAQAREAQIEAALERVRAKTMAMQKSDELLPTAEIMFDQLKLLGAELQGVAFAICDRNSKMVQKWTSIGNFSHPYNIEPGEQRMYEAWKNQSGMYEEVYEGEKQKKYYEKFMEIPDFRKGLQKIIDLGIPIPTWQKNYAVPFKNGYVLFIITKPFEETQIFVRFGKVFEQTYTRFLDLQKAEAAAREAIKQAALDRIRADIAAMRTVNDLDRITPLMWNELTILRIPFIRCGVFIMDEEKQLIHTFLSTPDGKAITAFHIPYYTPGNIEHVINHWRNNEKYIDHWDENAFTTFAQTLVEQGALASPEKYFESLPHGGFYLHFVPFLQGMLYVGNINQLSEEEINLIQSLANAFSTAYARYEDFNKLEVAKKQVDAALNELQATQKQLIQSEKMASLGELTAGIAHEIQNPLNFVNNFSEVNKEMLEELKAERSKPNADEALEDELINDLIDNSEKINHHGKRADAIVKGMLQHSRASTGKKEPTDINALADEYLRLSYHGLRAKDKSFNATIETDFDKSLSADKAGIGKINMIPQDIGRVLLNLFNNAFYACTERSRTVNQPTLPVGRQKSNNLISYEPKVSVTTKKSENRVCITVRDNGNGIPQKIIDKIFQPFFTTKPAGEGTGLGLSLAYDIVKAHGGEIKVESKEGEGSAFDIILPI